MHILITQFIVQLIGLIKSKPTINNNVEQIQKLQAFDRVILHGVYTNTTKVVGKIIIGPKELFPPKVHVNSNYYPLIFKNLKFCL